MSYHNGKYCKNGKINKKYCTSNGKTLDWDIPYLANMNEGCILIIEEGWFSNP